MHAAERAKAVSGGDDRPASPEQRLKALGITLPRPPSPFGSYVEAVQTGNLLFLSGMLPTEGRGAVVRLGVSVATAGDVRDQPKVADAASDVLQGVFGKDRGPCRPVFGVASLPLGTPVELELILEVSA